MKNVLITGASGGIGQALCKRFQESEYRIICLDREVNQNADRRWYNFQCDVSNQTQTKETLERIVQSHGTPDILVNNAGLYRSTPWDEITAEEFHTIMQVNLYAPFFISQYCAKKMIESQKTGVIVNMSSISAFTGSINPAYAGSKAAVVSMSKSLAKDLAPMGIRVLSVCPGPVETKMIDEIPKERKDFYKKSIPMQRFAKTDEIASVVWFMTNDEASYITGTHINIDGGLS